MSAGENRGSQSSLKGKLQITAVLRLESGLHIGASNDFAPIGAVDSPFIRDPFTKKPIIPGSSIKGKMRTLLAKSYVEGYILNAIELDKPVVARLFGTAQKNAAKASRLQFVDLKLSDATLQRFAGLDTDTYIGEIKFENAIDRISAVANPRQIERVPAGAEFDFELVYNVENETELEDDMRTLSDGFRLLQMDYLGGHGSRGYGRVSLHNFKLKAFSVSSEWQEVLENKCESLEALLEGRK